MESTIVRRSPKVTMRPVRDPLPHHTCPGVVGILLERLYRTIPWSVAGACLLPWGKPPALVQAYLP